VSSRPRRAFVWLVAAVAALAALPASALAAGETLTVTPTNTQAGGGTPVTATLTFAPPTGDNPTTVVTSLAPGMLGNLNANPSCLVGSPQLTPSCQIGTETTQTNGGAVPGTLYLIPPQGTDAAGIEAVAAVSSVPNQYTGVSLNPNAPGGLSFTTTFPAQPAGVQITGFTASFTTLNGQPFTRLPSSCATATSTMNVTYAGGTSGSASGSFTPTGCSSLSYAPKLTASIAKDASDNGATLVTQITQAADESASKSIALVFPTGLSPNVAADASCLVGSGGCTIGTATATSPLVPSPALANGKVSLGGTIAAPTLSIAFPAPFAITLNGAVNLATGAVTFASVPDVPLTSLSLNVTGPNGQKAFNTDCKPANLSGTFTGQNGATANVNTPIVFSGCPVKPTASGSTSGLASGHPKLMFKVAASKGAANLALVAVGLPSGLKFSHSAFVSHRACTTAANKKCTTTTLIKGLGVSGAKVKSAAIKGGKLVITFSKPVAGATLTVSGPLVTESATLQKNVKKHKIKSLTFSLKLTDAKKTATPLSLALTAH
jgi:hypothetical protein